MSATNGEIQFFLPDNQNPCGDMNKFVEYYSIGYDNQFAKDKLEIRIEGLLKSDRKLNDDDVENILCWKTGRACINLCKIDLEEVCKIATKMERGAPENPFFKSEEEQKRYLEFIDEVSDCQGIGIIYAIAILYFISNGKYPIYDCFTQNAMTALKCGCRLGEVVPASGIGMSDKKNSLKTYNQYCVDLESIFGDDYIRREVDKALWIYGHLFNKNEKEWMRYLKNIKLVK